LDDDDEDEIEGEAGESWEADASPGLDDPVEDAADADAEAPATSSEQTSMAQRMLAISPPVLSEVDALTLLAQEYSPLARRVPWLRFSDCGMVAAAPRGWRVFSGAGRLLGVPVRSHALCPGWGDDGVGGMRGGGGGGVGGDVLTGVRPGPDAHAVGLTLSVLRGAFASPLLARVHSSPHDVATFFMQLHIMRRQPPGLVRPGDFSDPGAPSGGGEAGGGPGGGFRSTTAQLRAALDAGSGEGLEQQPPGEGEAGHHLRRPAILASWARSLPRSEAMPGACQGEGEAAELRVEVPRALGPTDVLGAMGMGEEAPGGGARAGRPGAAAAAAGAAPRFARIAPTDSLHVFGLEYEVPAAPEEEEEEEAGGGPPAERSAGAPRTPRAGAPPADAFPARSSSAHRHRMRYCVSLILDPAADSVTEVTFAAPADVWEGLWGGDPAGEEEERAARAAGLDSVCGRQLLDAATVVALPQYDAAWQPAAFEGATAPPQQSAGEEVAPRVGEARRQRRARAAGY